MPSQNRRSAPSPPSRLGSPPDTPGPLFMRNVPRYAGKSGHRVVSALIATAFAQKEVTADWA